MPSVATAGNGDMVVGLVGCGGSGSSVRTPAAAWTEEVDHLFSSPNLLSYVMDTLASGAGPSATASPSFVGTVAGAWAFTVAISGVATAITPVADFTGTPLSGLAPLSVAFTNLSTG